MSLTSDMRLVLRVATPDDGPKLAEIAREAYGKYLDLVDEPPAPLLLDYEEIAALGRTHVAEAPGELLGMVTIETDGSYVILRNLAVRPACQGKGIGRTMVDLVEGMARARRLRGVRLWTRAEMSDNIAFYRRLGYVLTHSEQNEKAHRVFFCKDLERDSRNEEQ